jgi:hypothetical protein
MLLRLSLAGVLSVCIALAAEAHRRHLSWTSIGWNERTSSLEITHRLHAHDVQSYLTSLAGAEISIADLRGRAQVALYIANHFQIAVRPRSPALVNLLGAELDDRYLMVYQELALSAPPTGLDLRADIFMEQFSDQVNRVNININGHRQTLQFTKGNGNKHINIASKN